MNLQPQGQDLAKMNLNEGHILALTQLRSIESESNFDFEIIEYHEYSYNQEYLEINLSLGLRGFQKKQEGLQFRPRERVNILIHKDFPFELPSASFSDFRYMGKPHVQWGKHICLYQSVESDYDPSDGMFGYMDRLVVWLKKAAIGELDPTNAPLHPPVAYTSSNVNYKIIPNADVPEFNEDYWLGAAKLEKLNNDCFYISDWSELGKLKSKNYFAAAILLNNEMPFEYPFFLSNLIFLLDKGRIDAVRFIKHIQSVIRYNKSGTPLFVLIGTPMRGDAANRKQHLLCWYFESKIVRYLIGFEADKFKKNYNKAKDYLDKFIKHAETAKIDWCKILENRPEIIIPRDKEASTSLYKTRKVEIWGCGALGSHVAEIIVRAKAKEVHLYDNGIVKPGILSRQLFYEKNIGENKAFALKERLQNIYSKLFPLNIEGYKEDILNHLNTLHKNIDLIVDTTASQRVFRKVDKLIIENKVNIPFLSLVINNDAKKAMVILKPVSYNSGIFDIIRKAKLKLCSLNKAEWLTAFFPQKETAIKLIQPEPGCSDPTFIGSEADLNALSGLIINLVSCEVFSTEEAKVYFISQEIDKGNNSAFEQYSFRPYDNNLIISDSLNHYKIYLAQEVIDRIKEEISKSDRVHKPLHETGGLLFGEWDDLTKAIYISKVSGPPPDSKSSPNNFECGVNGTEEMNTQLKKKYLNSVYFVGLWHSHPFGSANYSEKDKVSMQLVVTKLSPPKSLLLIIGYDNKKFNISGFVFEKSQFNY